MTTVHQIYEQMQLLAPLQLAESWDNVGLLVDCGGPVQRVLTALDITPEVVAEAKQHHCSLIVSHHPVIFSPLKRLCPEDVPFQLVQAGISAICMHTNLDAAEDGVNELLASILGIRDPRPIANGCGRVGEITPAAVPELARRAQAELSARCNQPLCGPAVQVKYADAGKPVQKLAVISGAGGSLFEEALASGADCLLTGEANHHHACDALQRGLSIVAAGHYATEFPVAAAVAEKLRAAFPELEVLVSRSNRDPYLYLP
ncbi:MAG: Nif3-like dinuclear metal center hexameric protein [Faecalibacterium sp.]